MRKSKKAIFFNGEYNQFNAGYNMQCITYDEINGFQFVDGNKTISLPASATDKAQNAEIESLESVNNRQNDNIKALSELTNALINQVANGKIIIGDTATLGTGTISGLTNGTYTATTEVPNINIVGVTTDKQLTLQKADNVSINSMSANITKEITNVLTIKAKKDVAISNFELNGSVKTTNTNQIDIQTAEIIEITDSKLNASGYNGIMIGQGDMSVLPKKIIIENIDFNIADGQLTNNTINIFGTEANAEIIIRNCKFGKSSNPIRFGNNKNVSGVQVTVENCHFESWEQKRPWVGFLLFEAFADWTETKTKFPFDKSKGETSDKDIKYRTRVLPELIKIEDANNRFSKDKIKITFKNCTYGAENTPLVYAKTKYAKLFGTSEADQIVMLCRYSGYTSINQAFDEKIQAENVDGKYPGSETKYPDNQTWYAWMFPYDNNRSYLEEIAAPADITLTHKNSDCYPTIKFE